MSSSCQRSFVLLRSSVSLNLGERPMCMNDLPSNLRTAPLPRAGSPYAVASVHATQPTQQPEQVTGSWIGRRESGRLWSTEDIARSLVQLEKEATMKRIAIVMALSCALVALGSFSPFGTRWGHAALA